MRAREAVSAAAFQVVEALLSLPAPVADEVFLHRSCGISLSFAVSVDLGLYQRGIVGAETTANTRAHVRAVIGSYAIQPVNDERT